MGVLPELACLCEDARIFGTCGAVDESGIDSISVGLESSEPEPHGAEKFAELGNRKGIRLKEEDFEVVEILRKKIEVQSCRFSLLLTRLEQPDASNPAGGDQTGASPSRPVPLPSSSSSSPSHPPPPARLLVVCLNATLGGSGEISHVRLKVKAPQRRRKAVRMGERAEYAGGRGAGRRKRLKFI
eukprot:235526-Hanusia_phi.AAC.1